MVPLIQRLLSPCPVWMTVAKRAISSTSYRRRYHQVLQRKSKDLTVCQNVSHSTPSKFYCSSVSTDNVIVGQMLKNRGLVLVCGSEVGSFLQGLVTNDMAAFENNEDRLGCDCVYAMMLNVQGRILYDLIIYKRSPNDSSSFLIECDREVIPDFIKLMKRYKIRKKIDVTDVSKEYNVWAAFPKTLNLDLTTSPNITVNDKNDEQLQAFTDPRLAAIGKRLLLRDNQKVWSVVPGCIESSDDEYLVRRYQLGIGEGVIDLPPGGALPLECNAAFLNGVSFSKGCYIGQELTARSHHTGVIRKRLMPLLFQSEDNSCQPGDTVENSKGKNSGKFRHSNGKYGLGLLRIADVIGKGSLTVKREEGEGELAKYVTVGEVTTHIPGWWPTDTDEVIKQVLAAGTKTEKS